MQDGLAALSPTIEAMIIEEVRLLLWGRGERRSSQVGLDTSLVDDLAFDSLMFVDLTMSLEKRLDSDALPVQDWVDRESMGPGPKHTVRSLAGYLQDFLTNREGDG
jgi:acyl carrier protein